MIPIQFLLERCKPAKLIRIIKLLVEHKAYKLTCPLKINGWQMYFLLKQSFFKGTFVSFLRGGKIHPGKIIPIGSMYGIFAYI